MQFPGPGYAVTLRARIKEASLAGAVTQAVAGTGAVLTALDVAESGPGGLVADVTCDAVNAAHSASITAAAGALAGVSARKVSDRTFPLHLGSKLEVMPTVPLKRRDDLSRAHTEIQPGHGRVRDNPSFTDDLIPAVLDRPPVRITIFEFPHPDSPVLSSAPTILNALRATTGPGPPLAPVRPDDIALASPARRAGTESPPRVSA